MGLCSKSVPWRQLSDAKKRLAGSEEVTGEEISSEESRGRRRPYWGGRTNGAERSGERNENYLRKKISRSEGRMTATHLGQSLTIGFRPALRPLALHHCQRMTTRGYKKKCLEFSWHLKKEKGCVLCNPGQSVIRISWSDFAFGSKEQNQIPRYFQTGLKEVNFCNRKGFEKQGLGWRKSIYVIDTVHGIIYYA